MSSTWLAGRWMWNGLLLALLCLNAILIGYIATGWMKAERPPEALAGARIIERMAGRLPPADAEILRQVYRDKQNEFAVARENYLLALVRPIRLLRQDELDIGALRKALSDSRNKRQKIGDLVTETFIEAVARMSVDGRRKLVGGIAMK